MLLWVGCAEPPEPEVPGEPDLRALGELPGLRQSPLPELHTELAAIEAAGATPVLLTSNPLDDEDNAAALLVELLNDKLVELVLAKADELTPAGRFEFHPIQLEQAIRFRRRYDPLLAEVNRAFAERKCNFAIDFRLGFCADRSFVDRCRLVVRMESLHVAERLADELPADALPHVRNMLLIVRRLAEEKHVEARLAAAELRAYALATMESVVQHPAADRQTIETAGDIVQGELSVWPPDGDAWIGDRAFALHSFELIRAGRLMELLTEDEVRIFSDEGILHDLQAATNRNVDADELFYLQSMRRVIEACDRPYYERKALFAEIRKTLHAERNAADFPVAAARLFLPNLEAAHEIQAQDRARTEAWAIALALAVGRERPAYDRNPCSGKPYRKSVEPTRVSVWTDQAGDRPAMAPRFPPATARN
jgi:hypothetical protein